MERNMNRIDSGAEKAKLIFKQAKSNCLERQAQALDNFTCFTHPSNFKNRLELFQKEITSQLPHCSKAERKRLITTLIWLAISLNDSCDLRLNLQNEERHGKEALSQDELRQGLGKFLNFLEGLESGDKFLAEEVLLAEKQRLIKIMSKKGLGLLSARAKEANTNSLRGWISYWSEFGKNCHLRKFRENVGGFIGVDYGLGVRESRIFWGADLVMMNPTLARLALAEDDELEAMKEKLIKEYGHKYTKERLVREATKIAGLRARLASRAVFLLQGRGKVSFQVNPRTYNQPEKLEKDIRSLYQEFCEEALAYDGGLFLNETMSPEEIKERKGYTHVFFKVDGSSRAVYGKIEEVMLKQVRAGRINLAEDDSGGGLEQALTEGMNCNVTVAGFITDGLWSFFCQIRGHARARKKGLPLSHSIITKMGGRVEGAIRWLALQRLAEISQEKEIVEGVDYGKNGALDDESLRSLAKKAGLVLAEEIDPLDYPQHRGRIFPQDLAICTIAEAISKRSHEIMAQLKKHPLLRQQGVEEGETGDLQASMRTPYGGRYSHVEELAGMYAQGHFPDATLAIENWEGFKADPQSINKPADAQIINQLYHSIIGKDFAASYEVCGDLKEILSFLGIYKEEYGSKGLKIDELCRHPFSQQTLFGKVVDRIPVSEEEKDTVCSGFVGDFNELGDELQLK